MARDWTAYPFKRALATAVAARGGITGLSPTPRVITFFPSPDEPLTDSIILGHTVTDTNKEKVALGETRHDETVDIVSQIRVVRPGAGQTAADTAEDRAKTLLAEVDSEVRDNLPEVGDQTITGILTERTSSLFSWKSADNVAVKICLIEFTVRYRARTS